MVDMFSMKYLLMSPVTQERQPRNIHLSNSCKRDEANYTEGAMAMRTRTVPILTTSEAIDVIKNRLEQGTTIDSYMYVENLKLCLKQKDLVAAKQVH